VLFGDARRVTMTRSPIDADPVWPAGTLDAFDRRPADAQASGSSGLGEVLELAPDSLAPAKAVPMEWYFMAKDAFRNGCDHRCSVAETGSWHGKSAVVGMSVWLPLTFAPAWPRD
jgi:hypothetical protein